MGSDAISMMFHRRSGRADQSCLKEIDLCSAVHLSLDELELCDLAFGLAVRPRLDQGSMDRGDVFGDPRSEGADQAVACGGNPGNKISLFPISDHGVKPIGECCSRSAQVRSSGLIVVAPIAARIGRIDLRTALKKAELAFSIRCHRSATWMVQGNAFEAASPYPPPRSRERTVMSG